MRALFPLHAGPDQRQYRGAEVSAPVAKAAMAANSAFRPRKSGVAMSRISWR
ncbi:hypothetical protein AB0L79_13650 [Streptomyces tendae]|uniref:hypothetical protein n=1 Tax=Streptomyces tendae TaxID=1932 RepID=UPI0034203889